MWAVTAWDLAWGLFVLIRSERPFVQVVDHSRWIMEVMAVLIHRNHSISFLRNVEFRFLSVGQQASCVPHQSSLS